MDPMGIPSRELEIPYQGTFEDDFPSPKVGYVSFLEGIFDHNIYEQ